VTRMKKIGKSFGRCTVVDYRWMLIFAEGEANLLDLRFTSCTRTAQNIKSGQLGRPAAQTLKWVNALRLLANRWFSVDKALAPHQVLTMQKPRLADLIVPHPTCGQLYC